MTRSTHIGAKIIGPLRELETGQPATDVARELGVSRRRIYAGKKKSGGLDVSEAQELGQPGSENHRLKKLASEPRFDKEMLKAVISRERAGLAGRREEVR